ncbi:uncharacterized protein LOC112542840 isoform X2 [Python bivittatus]|uniref:Uncharacterized protein LOC112542840 isoform X2 n=1 Tax=Python bivittatus TaxID=176946 RepID=A0A9F5J8U7_PYTBI|nr:uncharacterized protein LOC112542840 isoform X2 [Python bivittatus]
MDRKSQMKKFAHSAARNLTVVSAAVLTTPCCLAEGVADKYVGQCNSTGELPAPQFFLNGSSVQEGEWVLLQCLHSNEFEVKNFYFCKDGHPLSTPTALLYDGTYKVSLQISPESAGQYSCGYQSMDRKSQMKKSAHSAARNLTVISENELSVFTKELQRTNSQYLTKMDLSSDVHGASIPEFRRYISAHSSTEQRI